MSPTLESSLSHSINELNWSASRLGSSQGIGIGGAHGHDDDSISVLSNDRLSSSACPFITSRFIVLLVP